MSFCAIRTLTDDLCYSQFVVYVFLVQYIGS